MQSSRFTIIDSHCHLDFDYSPKDTGTLVAEANQAGVVNLVSVATEIPTLKKVSELSERFECVYHTAGVHPHEAKHLVEGDMEILAKAAKHPKCKAIGEIGLDYHYDHSPRDLQLKWLQKQLNVAKAAGLPVVIHSREAEAELGKALENHVNELSSRMIPGVIHCFTGTKVFAKICLDLGFYISFSGILTFKNSDDLRETAKWVPLNRLMVETDSPYLAPVPFRGKKCEPKMVVQTTMALASLRGLSLDHLAQATLENTRKVFAL